MLENEERKNEYSENIDEQQENIFAEEDVIVPEETADQSAGEVTENEGEPAVQTENQDGVNPEDPVSKDAADQMRNGDGVDHGDRIDHGMGMNSEDQMKNGNDSEGQKRYQEANPYSYIPEDKVQKKNGSREKKHKKHMNNYAKAICCAVLCGVIVGGCIIGSYAIGKNAIQASVPVTTNDVKLTTASGSGTDENGSSKSGAEYTVSQIAQQCSSSVVAITNKAVSEVQTMFGVYQQESEGSGSGVIVSQTDTELLIVTNYHVIEGSEELTVCFNDSEDAVFSAQVKGTDAANDLAVIAIQLSDISEDVLSSISIATIGNSDNLQVGDEVVAIGNALGLGQSVTSGIVSALDREVTIDETAYTLLQTDAAINPGNSGGALFNMKGELIGINSAKYASEEVEGMGFAISMSTAQPIIESLMTKETRTKLDSNYGCLNITGNTVSTEAIEIYGIPEGVYVYEVLEGGAAANAGIQEGDIITSIDGTALSGIDDLKAELQYYAAGETVEVVIQRNGTKGYESQTLTVTLDNASEQDESAFESNSSRQGNSSVEDGQGNFGSDGSLDNGFTFR